MREWLDAIMPEGRGQCRFCKGDVLFLQGERYGLCFNGDGPDGDCGHVADRFDPPVLAKPLPELRTGGVILPRSPTPLP